MSLVPKHDHVNGYLHSPLPMKNDFIWDLQSVFQMAHNLHEPRGDFSLKMMKKWRKLQQLYQRSSCEVIPDIRNGMKIFSPVSGWMMACVQRARHHPHAARSPQASMYGGVVHLSWCMTGGESLTCLIFWASHSCTGEEGRERKDHTINLQVLQGILLHLKHSVIH